jgi:acyl carrier protein
MTNANGEVGERVRRLFLEELNIDVPAVDADLIESGLIDSLTLVELLFAIEREFAVQLPFDDLEVDSFRSVATISKLVESANGSPPA